MKEIKLFGKNRSGLVALVDDEDFERVNQYKWWRTQRRRKSNYAQGRVKGRRMILLHRFVLGIEDKPTPHIDHINRDGLDNRRCNLRLVTNSQNQQNSKKRRAYGGKPTSSQFKGVCFHSGHKTWGASFRKDNKSYHIGYFNTEIEAAKAYNKFAKENFGKFARLNEI